MSTNKKVVNSIIQKFLLFSSILSGFLTIFTLFLRFFKWGSKGFFQFLQNNILILWLFFLTFSIFLVIILIFTLYKRYIKGFNDSFHKNLSEKWDYRGEWHVEDNSLIVTKSGDGGLCKKGALWENYTLFFKAKIIKDCIGVILRAQDLNNYYMFQIREDCIRPHRRASIPEIITNKNGDNKNGQDDISQSIKIEYKTGWETFDKLNVRINPALSDWFNVKIKVNGESVNVYINDNMVFQQVSFLKNPIDKIGFRNAGNESAQIRNVRVDLQY